MIRVVCNHMFHESCLNIYVDKKLSQIKENMIEQDGFLTVIFSDVICPECDCYIFEEAKRYRKSARVNIEDTS